MSYSKTIWKPGDIITTEKWNNLTNNVPTTLKIIQIPLELIENEGETISKLLIASEQLNNYIKNGYLCYYIYDNAFYYYYDFSNNKYDFISNGYHQYWSDNGNGYLEQVTEHVK